MLGSLFERSAEEFAPYAGHASEGVVLLMDNSYAAMIALHGVPFQLQANTDRNAQERRLNTLLRAILDDNLTVCAHLVRHSRVRLHAAGPFRSAYARQFYDDYTAELLDGQLRVNEWYLTLIVSPRLPGTRQIRKLLKRQKHPSLSINEGLIRQLEDTVQLVLASLSDFGARRQGIRQEGPVQFSEIGEALQLFRLGVWLPVPLVFGSLGASITTHRVVVGSRAFEMQVPGQRRYGAIQSLREYPDRTHPGMFNALLGADCDLVLSQSIKGRSRAEALALLSLKESQLLNAHDKAKTQAEGLVEAQDDVASGRVAMGQHHLSLAVYADSLPRLDTALAGTQAALAGAVPVVESGGVFGGLEAAYWSQLPGNWEWRTRPGNISTRNFVHMASLENFPTGAAEGYWGAPLIRFRSTGGTPYDFVSHVEDVGHMLLLGRTGRGKTALINALILSLEQAMSGGRGTVVLIDKDCGGELTVRASGGRYLALRRGRASGLAPLHGLSDTPGNRAFLQQLFTGLIMLDRKGGLSPDEERRLARGIGRQMQMPTALRTMTGVRELLGYSDPRGAGARFEKWCHGGANGWLFDNDEDEVRLDAELLGFDLTELLPRDEAMTDDGAANAAAAYIFHRLRELMDGRRLAVFGDEVRFYLPTIGRVLEDLSLTGRKKELLLALAAQEPEHLLSHPVGPSLVSQAVTTIIFPNARARRPDYVDQLGLTEAEFEQVRGDMLLGNARRFLVKREGGSVICEFDLSALPQHLAVLSGRVGTVRLLDRVRSELGDDPAHWLPEFQRRRLLERRSSSSPEPLLEAAE